MRGPPREKVGQHCPHRLVVMRLPLTKVVEVETERKPSPASAPELKDEAKKSGEGNNRVSARVGGMGRHRDRPCARGCSVLGLHHQAGAGSTSYLRILGREKRSGHLRGAGNQVLAAQRRAASHLEGMASPSASALQPGEPGARHCHWDPPGPALHLIPKPSGCTGAREVPQDWPLPPTHQRSQQRGLARQRTLGRRRERCGR